MDEKNDQIYDENYEHGSRFYHYNFPAARYSPQDDVGENPGSISLRSGRGFRGVMIPLVDSEFAASDKWKKEKTWAPIPDRDFAITEMLVLTLDGVYLICR